MLQCLECEKYARWHVWYKGFSSPTSSPFLDEHMIEEVKNGREGWQVVCIRLVADQFLPETDRAKADRKEGGGDDG